jgi:putative Mn2+ efflux pump MntP
MAENTTPQRRRVSVIGVVFALIFLAVASVGFTGDPWWLVNAATKWVVAGIVAVIGVSLLASALPGRQRNKVN